LSYAGPPTQEEQDRMVPVFLTPLGARAQG